LNAASSLTLNYWVLYIYFTGEWEPGSERLILIWPVCVWGGVAGRQAGRQAHPHQAGLATLEYNSRKLSGALPALDPITLPYALHFVCVRVRVCVCVCHHPAGGSL